LLDVKYGIGGCPSVLSIRLPTSGLKALNCTVLISLVQLVGPHITKKNTNWRMALEPEEKLIITLR